MRHYITIVISLIVTGWIIGIGIAHEESGMIHDKMPGCYGWELTGSNMRRCYVDKTQETCTDLIYTHGQWHVSEEYPCP